jgi:biopolymer transport protein ExbD
MDYWIIGLLDYWPGTRRLAPALIHPSTNPSIRYRHCRWLPDVMRRFSQRSHLVTLSDINITPLLDLAFVLLIIFVITTPLLEKSMDLQLPKAGQPEKKLNQSDIRTVEISSTGIYAVNKQRLPLTRIIAILAAEFKRNPNLVVYIRADKDCRYDMVAEVLDGCQRYGLTRYSLRTDPTPK